MADNSFTGISFPFRIGVKGGVVTSTTSVQDSTHIVEAMEQILLTHPNERGMEYHFKSDLDTSIFEPNDVSTHTLIAYQVSEALRLLEDRIVVKKVVITSKDTVIYATIQFTVIQYDTDDEATIRIGDLT